MFAKAYFDILTDSPTEARAREYEAIQHSIELMKAAEAAGIRSREAIVALNYIRGLWTILLEDLASPENALPSVLRAQLISIGLSILRQSDEIRMEHVQSFSGLIEISQLIGDGLK